MPLLTDADWREIWGDLALFTREHWGPDGLDAEERQLIRVIIDDYIAKAQQRLT